LSNTLLRSNPGFGALQGYPPAFTGRTRLAASRRGRL